MSGNFRSKSNRQSLTDSEISGLVHMAKQANLNYVIQDRFYIIKDKVKYPMMNVSELLRFIRNVK
jgi:hypothetical protein